MTWCAGRGGRRLELLNPTPAEVDWHEIAWSLATLNRYCGHAETPISVGLHTLIVVENAPPALKPFALLHDAHEARLGDTTSPIKETFEAMAAEVIGERGPDVMRQVRKALELRHDAAIHAAAGLPRPSAAQKALIKTLDLRALATERRDFVGWRFGSPEWVIDHERVEPFRTVYRFKPHPDVADALLAAFRRYLPALRDHGLSAA